MISKEVNLRSSVFMFITFMISLLIILFVLKGLRITSFLFIIIIFTLSFNLSSMISLKKKNQPYLGWVGLIIGFLTTLIWLIVNFYLSSHLGTRVTFSIETAFLAWPLLIFYSLIGFLAGKLCGWSEKRLKIYYMLRVVSMLLLVFFIALTINKDKYLLNQYNANGIFCDEFEINFAPGSGGGDAEYMYLTLFGDRILKNDCKMDSWNNIIKKYPDIKVMDDAITQKNPNKCEEIKNKKLELTKDKRFVKPIRSLVYECRNLKGIYDECIYSLALITKDEQLCIKLSKEQLKEDCYFDMAMLNSNKSLCEKVSDKRGHFDFGSFRDLCYTDVEKTDYPKGYFDKNAGRILINGTLELFDKPD